MNKPMATDDMIARAQKGDRAAFAHLINGHYDFMFRTAYKWCGNREDAEDLAQDVCVKLASVIGQFDGRSAFSSWLYRIVLNAVRDRQRQGMRQRNQVEALGHVSPSELAADQESAVAESQIWDAVRRLPDKQRDAVLLVYAEDKSHGEAAMIMDVKESTVPWYIHEAKKTLKPLVGAL